MRGGFMISKSWLRAVLLNLFEERIWIWIAKQFPGIIQRSFKRLRSSVLYKN